MFTQTFRPPYTKFYRGQRIQNVTIDIYTVDTNTMLPVHIVLHEEATAKSTTQDGGKAETSVNAFV